MIGSSLFRLSTFWMMHMADIFKHVLISGEMAYLSEPLIPAPIAVIPAPIAVIPAPIAVIPAQAGTHPDTRIDVNLEMDPRLRGDDSNRRGDDSDRRGDDSNRRGDDSKLSYSLGLTDGIAQENARLHDQFNTLDALLHSIPEAISENRRLLSAEIADIVLLIAHKLFINQQQNKDSIRHQITQIIDELNNKQSIEIALHPHELALIQQDGINIDTQSCKNLTLIPDVSLRLGGCIVKSAHGMFDAGIERQIDNLKQVLLHMRGLHE